MDTDKMSGRMSAFWNDTRGVDTIPLKLVVYLALTGVVMLLIAVSWGNVMPVIQGADVDEQITDAALKITSVQRGAARDLLDRRSADGSMCVVELSLPDNVRFIGFGVDPDPDTNGNLTDSIWVVENNTIVYQYSNGVKKRVFLNGDIVLFMNGMQDASGRWVIDTNLDVVNGHGMGVVIEGPVSGEFIFEMVFDGEMYMLSHF
ncbi:MAG: hypothetical protein Q7J10_01490 [Methanosarcinaceae archaeon]|nr:hypothetical protein [Methanosarcinaceae archaeon]